MASSTAGVRSRSPRPSIPRPRGQLRSWGQAGLFLRNFLRHPLMLGSAIPSSRYLIARILDQVDWAKTRTAVEYGPGVGTFTRPILERLSPKAKLLAIELNADFAELLRDDVSDPRLKIAQGSCVDVSRWMRSHRLPRAEFVLSGIPYTVLPGNLRHRILLATREALADNGVFVVYQYTRAVLPDLQQVFDRVEEDFEPLNILPARVFYCRK
jgi:phospholipid N-methyltransferase